MNNRRIILSITYVLIGIVLLVMTSFGLLDSIMYGFGTGLLVCGALLTYKNLKYKNNPEYRENRDIEINDERNKLNRMKAWSYAGYITVILFAIATIVAMVASNRDKMMAFSMPSSTLLFIYLVSYIIISKKN